MNKIRVRPWWLLIAAPLLMAPAGTYWFYSWDYQLNAASFATLPGLASVDVTPTVVDALRRWEAYGSSAAGPQINGTTTGVGCPGWTIAASASCPPWPLDCLSTIASNWYCAGGSHAIVVYGGCTGSVCTNSYTVGPSLERPTPLHNVITHEIGHSIQGSYDLVNKGHIFEVNQEVDSCFMSGQPGASRRVEAFGFCTREIQTLGMIWPGSYFWNWGPGFQNTPIRRATSSTIPPSSWTAAADTGVTTGIGGFDVARGNTTTGVGVERIFRTLTTVDPHFPSTCAPFACGSSKVDFSHPDYATVRRPTVVYDPVRKVWFGFVTSSTEQAFQGGTNRVDTLSNRVQMAWSVDGVGWFGLGMIGGVSTNYPVAAAYDPVGDNVVIAWVNSRVVDSPAVLNCNHASYGGFGCSGEVIVTTLEPSTSSLVVRSHIRLPEANPSMFGFAIGGMPALVCDSGAYYQCEVFGTELSVAHSIASRRLCLTSSGQSCGLLPRQVEFGWTDFPISVSPRRFDGSGVIAMAVTAQNRTVQVRTKSSMNGTWSAWQVAIQGPANSGPVIRLHPVLSQYELSVAIQ